jgi:hypothetical protein
LLVSAAQVFEGAVQSVLGLFSLSGGGVPMNRAKFLKDLKALWAKDASPLTLEDLLDDVASLGVEGASDCYLWLLHKSEPRDINPDTGNLTNPNK